MTKLMLVITRVPMLHFTGHPSNRERFDKVIANLEWCSFLPHSVVHVM